MTSPFAEQAKPPTIEQERPRLLGIIREHCRDAMVGLTPSRMVQAEDRLVAFAYNVERFSAASVFKHHSFSPAEEKYLRAAIAGPLGSALTDPIAAAKAKTRAEIASLSPVATPAPKAEPMPTHAAIPPSSPLDERERLKPGKGKDEESKPAPAKNYGLKEWLEQKKLRPT